MRKKKNDLDVLSDQEKDLKIKSLEKALELEKLRSKGFEVMIDVAEKQLNIPIRKKLAPNSERTARRIPPVRD